jgi:carboxymethylenebutenolidase
MTESTQIKIPQEAFDWYDEYAHGDIDRRTFMSRLATLAGMGVSMSLLTSALIPNYALAEQVSFNDPDIYASYATFESPDGYLEGRGYLVRPSKLSGKVATVLVAHENRGLNPYIKDVARRLAKQGYLAFAPDALHTLGGYPGNDDEGKAMQKSLDRSKIEQDFIAAAKFLDPLFCGHLRCHKLLRKEGAMAACQASACRLMAQGAGFAAISAAFPFLMRCRAGRAVL